MSAGSKLLSAANAPKNSAVEKFLRKAGKAGLDAAFARQSPTFGQPGAGRRLLAAAEQKDKNAR